MSATPRYAELATLLRKAIANGDYAVGDLLPTEHEVCTLHGVSRHTARAALGLLETDGLISRRPGVGTLVIAERPGGAFSQPLGGLEELMQYARDARLRVLRVTRKTLSADEARMLEAEASSHWLKTDGVRSVDGVQIAVTNIYVNDFIAVTEEQITHTAFAITEVIEENFGVAIARIEQSIAAEILSADDADILRATPGTPCLRTVRRYFDDAGRIFVISDTRHPADRFTYNMSFQRNAK